MQEHGKQRRNVNRSCLPFAHPRKFHLETTEKALVKIIIGLTHYFNRFLYVVVVGFLQLLHYSLRLYRVCLMSFLLFQHAILHASGKRIYLRCCKISTDELLYYFPIPSHWNFLLICSGMKKQKQFPWKYKICLFIVLIQKTMFCYDNRLFCYCLSSNQKQKLILLVNCW